MNTVAGTPSNTFDQQQLEQRLNACIGVVSGPQHGWDAVNLPMIRHWCDAMGDDNPLYSDVEFAREHRHHGIIAPPAMLQAWTMVGYRGRAPAGSRGLPEGADDPFELLSEAGFPAVVAVNCDQQYFQPLKLGDEVYHTKTLESFAGPKTTALGFGYFTTDLYTYFNQRDEKVAEMRFRLLRFKPAMGAQA